MKILDCGDNFQSNIIISEKCHKITPNYLLLVPHSNESDGRCKEYGVPSPVKYPVPQRWQTLRKQFLEASDWFTIIERMSLICRRLGYHSMNLDNSRNSLHKICHL